VPWEELVIENVTDVRTPLVARTAAGTTPVAPDSPCMLPATAAAPKTHRRMNSVGAAITPGAVWATRTSGAN
jgi:hypothetical protein